MALLSLLQGAMPEPAGRGNRSCLNSSHGSWEDTLGTEKEAGTRSGLHAHLASSLPPFLQDWNQPPPWPLPPPRTCFLVAGGSPKLGLEAPPPCTTLFLRHLQGGKGLMGSLTVPEPRVGMESAASRALSTPSSKGLEAKKRLQENQWGLGKASKSHPQYWRARLCVL